MAFPAKKSAHLQIFPATIPPRLPLPALGYTLQFFLYGHCVGGRSACAVEPMLGVFTRGCVGVCTRARAHAHLCTRTLSSPPVDLVVHLVTRRSSESLTVTRDKDGALGAQGACRCSGPALRNRPSERLRSQMAPDARLWIPGPRTQH